MQSFLSTRATGTTPTSDSDFCFLYDADLHKQEKPCRTRPSSVPGDDVIVLTPTISAASYSKLKQEEGLQVSVRVSQESLIKDDAYNPVVGAHEEI